MKPKKSREPLSDFDNSIIVAIIGIVFLVVLILNKTMQLSIPIFGKELDFFGINWKIYVKRNWFWFTVSIFMIITGVLRVIVILITLKNEIKKSK